MPFAGAFLFVILVAAWVLFWADRSITVENELQSKACMFLAFLPGFCLLAAMLSH
jgi:hypothetical protein